MPTLEQLQLFLATVETGSFSAAARRLNKVQSAVSQQIINMEIDCDKQLFDRSGRYPVLTPAGQTLLPQAKAVIAQHLRLQSLISSLDAGLPQQFRLAIDEGVPFSELSQHLSLFADKYPLMQLELRMLPSKEIIEQVRQQNVDMGVIFSEEIYPQQIDFESLGSVKFEPVVSPNHPLAKAETNNLDQLKLHRQLTIGSKQTQQSSFQAEHSPQLWLADSYYALLDLAKSGFGWTLLPEHLVQDALAQGQLCPIPLNMEQMGWIANVDLIQHSSVNQEVSQVFRQILSAAIA
ncbi:LysR family transcriptional regulator [Shewanella rhizosphaerae]|uniref:LysR family transcriptional regulator n=1 Tax=Shewanella rhizosphaerae TaxID=2864207 RepID=UPI001C6572F1|nr:LysR family transcriptional regulator [Shewanella rhizosphaerae]QYK14035.1 LysR family transcriptional regulator [Shewanella rhizosphaerae]